MEKDWVLVYTANKKYNADVLEEVFNDYDIKSIAINKKDSLYGVYHDLCHFACAEHRGRIFCGVI